MSKFKEQMDIIISSSLIFFLVSFLAYYLINNMTDLGSLKFMILILTMLLAFIMIVDSIQNKIKEMEIEQRFTQIDYVLKELNKK